jgi:hypothetical protein
VQLFEPVHPVERSAVVNLSPSGVVQPDGHATDDHATDDHATDQRPTDERG